MRGSADAIPPSAGEVPEGRHAPLSSTALLETFASGYRAATFGYRGASVGYPSAAFGYRAGDFGYRAAAFGYRKITFGYRAETFGYRKVVLSAGGSSGGLKRGPGIADLLGPRHPAGVREQGGDRERGAGTDPRLRVTAESERAQEPSR